VRWTAPARFIMDRRPLPHAAAHQSSASSRSRARELRPRGGGGEGRAGELNNGVTASWEVVEGRLTGDGASAQKGGGEGIVRAKRRSAGGVGVFTEGGGEAGEAGHHQWPVLKELQCPWIEGAGY
jgi:hypothetical protein